MSKVLVISGHPNLAQSNTNTVILNTLSTELNDVSIRRLDALYPDYQIDIAAEQQALIEAQVVVLQFPFYWYSVPALLKKWIDDVFAYDFAYGANGDKLKDKELILSFTVGGPAESYTPLNYNHFPIAELIKPLQQTAYLAGMRVAEPIFTHGMVYIEGVYNKLSDVQAKAQDHAERLITSISHLIDSPEAKLQRFVAQWFEKFDVLAPDSEQFTKHLASDIRLVMPEGEFNGHAGFKDWYQGARATFKPNCDHDVEQMQVKALSDDRFEVELRIRLTAETFAESAFGGEAVNILVNELWQVSFDENDNAIIHEYLVEVVS